MWPKYTQRKDQLKTFDLSAYEAKLGGPTRITNNFERNIQPINKRKREML